MNEIFYIVTFERDCSAYYFHNIENAKKMLLESFLDDNEDATSEEIEVAQDELERYNMISDYAYLDTEFFEDER